MRSPIRSLIAEVVGAPGPSLTTLQVCPAIVSHSISRILRSAG